MEKKDNEIKGTPAKSNQSKTVEGAAKVAEVSVKHYPDLVFASVKIAIEICREGAQIPKYAHKGDAGMDVYATEDYKIAPGETMIIPLGIKVAIPEGYELQVRPRSGQSLKTKIRIANSPGTIDSNYRDEVGVIVENITPMISDFAQTDHPHIIRGKSITIEKGQRFAQLVLAAVPVAEFEQVDDVSTIGQNRNGGFGSTGEV